MDICYNDLKNCSATLKFCLAIDDSQEITVTARNKSGAKVNIQDQILADNSLSDFLKEVEEVIVIQT